MAVIVGWDIGGVHLKAARAENGRIVAAMQIASPLRFGLERLTQAFAQAKAAIGPADRHVVTMTGELADTFSSRAEGVTCLAALAARELGDGIQLYAGRRGFLAPDRAAAHVEDIASANWHASATLVGHAHDAALFADMGSTTTDLIPIVAGRVAAGGYTDSERLATGELVYTGLVRGFVMATADRAPFAGCWTPLINENFANLADVHRILGSLPDGADQQLTADGRDKSVEASRARLARMVGRDAADAGPQAWTALARWFAECQLRNVMDAALLLLSGVNLPAHAPVIGAGSGVAVLRELARRLARPYRGFEAVLDVAPTALASASDCAPAAALAALASVER